MMLIYIFGVWFEPIDSPMKGRWIYHLWTTLDYLWATFARPPSLCATFFRPPIRLR